MSKKFSEKLIESVKQGAEIMRGTKAPSRLFQVDGAQRKIREISPATFEGFEQSAPSRGERQEG